MKKRIRLYTLFLLCSVMACTHIAFAQGMDNVWIFGWDAGLDFSSGTPSAFYCPILDVEGSASVCDTNGQLLFYTDGRTIFNRNYATMPNGLDLIGVNPNIISGTPQATIIVPKPGNNSVYYVFTLEEDETPGKLFYSVVDMEMDGGLGDVIPGKKTILIDSGLTEKMTDAPGKNGNIWLVVRSQSTNEYKAYSISSSGVNTNAVISTVGEAPLATYEFGTLKFSPDNKKLATALVPYDGSNLHLDTTYVELYDFDACTGQISHATILDTCIQTSLYEGGYFSVCFSPDNTKLYATRIDSLFQFDLTQPGISAIQASKTLIAIANAQTDNIADLKIGPDGKIYIVAGYEYFLDCIKFPNLTGNACGYQYNAIALAPSSSFYGLPTRIVSRNELTTIRDTLSTVSNLTACSEITLQVPDTFSNYLWNTGATDADITVTTPGIYWVQTNKHCVVSRDSFIVDFVPRPKLSLGNDTTICIGESITLSPHADIPEPFTLSWSTGSHAPVLSVADSGTYWLKASFPPCISRDSIHITTEHCGCLVQMPTAFSPSGDGLNDIFMPAVSSGCLNIRNYVLHIYNRWGQLVFRSLDLQKGWDGNFGGKPEDVGTYYFTVHYIDHKGKNILKKGTLTLVR